MVTVLFSPQTCCRNELEGIGGPSGEARLSSSSSTLAVRLGRYSQSFQLACKTVRRLSDESALILEPLLLS